MTSDGAAARAISWHWSFFALGVVYSIPAVVVIPFHPVAGLGLAIGVMPVAAYNLPGLRKGRRVILSVGVVSAASVLMGSLLAQNAIVAVVGMFALALAFSLWARDSRAGIMALVLCLPLVGIALSIDDIALAALIAVLVLAGSVYAWAVAMLWPEHRVPPPLRGGTASAREAAVYGVLLGGAAATATAAGFALGFAHVGWATGAALLIMQPVRDQVIRRSVRRATAVVVGAVSAAVFDLLDPAPAVIAAVIGLVLASMSATQASRWYVTPAFTTFIGLTLILRTPDARAGTSLVERLVETGIGVGVALFFGAVIPLLINVWRARAREGNPQ